MAGNGNKTFQERHNEQEAEREAARAEAEKVFEDQAKQNLKPSAPTAPAVPAQQPADAPTRRAASKPVGAMSTESTK